MCFYLGEMWSVGGPNPEKMTTSLSRVWSIAKYAGIPAASIPSMMASMYTRA